MIRRGDIGWAGLGLSRGSAPAKRRPVLVVQADAFNASTIATVVVAALTSNTALARYPGNVELAAELSGLTRDCVVNVTAIQTLDRDDLDEPVTHLPTWLMDEVDRGLRLVLALGPVDQG